MIFTGMAPFCMASACYFLKDEACIYDESKVKEIHDIIFSIKIDLDLDLDLERTLGDGNRERGWKERGRAFINLL